MNRKGCKIKYACLLLFIVILFVLGTAVRRHIRTEKILKQTWEQLSKSEQSEAGGTWTGGSVEEVILQRDNAAYIIQEQYYGTPVLRVTFPDRSRGISGDIVKLVDKESGEIIGIGFRE